MKITAASMIPILLSVASYSMADISNADCGLGYDTLLGEKRPSPFQKVYCDIRELHETQHSAIQIVHDYRDIIKLLKIAYNEKFFKNYFVQKLMNNTNINRYTITIAVVENQNIYENYIQHHTDEQNVSNHSYGDCYIASVKNGGMHLLLYHIQTEAEYEYHKIFKKLTRENLTVRHLQKFLQSLPPEKISVREYFSKGLGGIPTQELAESFQHEAYFKDLLEKNALPYRYTLQKYRLYDNNQTKQRRKKLISEIDTILQMQYNINSYRYYRLHEAQFQKIPKAQELALFNSINRYKDIIAHTIQQHNLSIKETNSTICPLPERYNACAGIKKEQIKPETISFKINKFPLKPDTNNTITFTLTDKLDIQNRGKITRSKIKLSVRIGTKFHEETQKTKLLFDSYVDFPSLRFKNIKNNYGKITFTLPFNRYTQQKEIQGNGIIQKAQCGYDLSATGIMKVFCKDIKFSPIVLETANE